MADRFILTRDPQAADVRYLPTAEYESKLREVLDELPSGGYDKVEPFLDLEGRGFIVDDWITYRESRVSK